MPINQRRVRSLNSKPVVSGPVVYWMSRDQRVNDNWALLYAQQQALKSKQQLQVIFTLLPTYSFATQDHFAFMMQGIEKVAQQLEQLRIPLIILEGKPEDVVMKWCESQRCSQLVVDFSPLRDGRRWREFVARTISMSCVEVDAHNIIPCWIASNKLEYGAYTLRPKIHKLLSEFLEHFPTVQTQEQPSVLPLKNIVSKSVWKRKTLLLSGEQYAHIQLRSFLEHSLHQYEERKNDPNMNAQSNLSAYLHFGQLSAQRVALEVQVSKVQESIKQVFLEELIVRKELSDNFCFYEQSYDSFEGFPNWAQLSLNQHRKDTREYVYTYEQFEQAETHDALWNAAQQEMVKTGKMHGYMRMYWAKKILEWTQQPDDALAIAIKLNDTYELDGRDPNGYAGIAWSIGGVHDRAWFDRPVFGKVRYMNANGCAKKFDVQAYIKKIAQL